jgi:hypothetical protein
VALVGLTCQQSLGDCVMDADLTQLSNRGGIAAMLERASWYADPEASNGGSAIISFTRTHMMTEEVERLIKSRAIPAPTWNA